MYELRSHNSRTRDEQFNNEMFPLREWSWFDGLEDTGGL
jgi:hypothetical protein